MTLYTRSGQEVINPIVKERNSTGNIVTFPIKGSIVRKRNKRGAPTKMDYCIWMEDGHASVLEYKDDDDLMITKDEYLKLRREA